MARVFGLGKGYVANFAIARDAPIPVWALKKSRCDEALSPLQSPGMDGNTPTNHGLDILCCRPRHDAVPIMPNGAIMMPLVWCVDCR